MATVDAANTKIDSRTDGKFEDENVENTDEDLSSEKISKLKTQISIDWENEAVGIKDGDLYSEGLKNENFFTPSEKLASNSSFYVAQNENDLEKISAFRLLLSNEINEILTDHDCLRFLRARSYNLNKAKEMVLKWDHWWKTPLPGTSSLFPKDLSVLTDEKEHIFREMLPHSNLGEDREGRPLYWEKTGLISSRFSKIKKLLSEDEIVIRHIRQQEKTMDRLRFNSIKYNKLIDKQIIIFDLKNVSFSIDTMAMRIFRKTLVIDESCYPERLHRLYMINAPSFFAAIWSVIKPWLHPVTVDKIQIIGSDYLPKLLECIEIDQIPVEYGGTKTDFFWTVPENELPLI
eukprot:gene10133-13631_t